MRSFMHGPNGEAQIFDSEDDAPAGWVDHPGKAKASEPAKTDDPMVALRAAYRAKFGKGPGPRWDEAKIREKLAEKE